PLRLVRRPPGLPLVRRPPALPLVRRAPALPLVRRAPALPLVRPARALPLVRRTRALQRKFESPVPRPVSMRHFAAGSCAVAAVMLSACTAVPTSGAVHAGQQSAPSGGPNVRVEARRPVPGDTPQ